MSHNEVRKGVTNAKFNEEQSGILFGEMTIISIVIGLYAQSWWIFGITLAGLIIALFIPIIAIPLMVVLSIGWGIIGYGIGALFGSTGASVVIGIIGFVAGIGVHFSALQWAKDIGEH
ncbi:hypothetical protein [Vibrio metschnikovii]|nr:hypothetical protein [Vibrio metschnikovii]